MKLIWTGKDGGSESTVWGYWLVEIKRLFSIALLRFEHGTREAFHNHAFNSISWLLVGTLREQHRDGTVVVHKPSLRPIKTYRDTFHKVASVGRSWVLTFRGPWTETWKEHVGGRDLVLSNGRKVVA